jgi:ankyrin repeat protein
MTRSKASINLGSKDGITPLHAAAFGGHVNVVGLLIDHGADVNASDYNGYTPLYFAAIGEREECVQILKRKGAVMRYTAKKL